MQSDEKNVAVSRPRGWRRLLFVAVAVCAAAGIVLSLLPYAIERGAVAWLQQHGVEDARIDNIDLNLFSGEATLEGLKSGDGLRIDHFSLDFDWLPLWRHIVHVRTLTLNASSLHLLQQQGIWQVAGITATGPSDKSPVEDQQGALWRLVVDDLLLKDVKLQVKTDAFRSSVLLKSLRVSLSPLLQQVQQQQQRLSNSIEIGETSFSGFGYSAEVSGGKISGEVMLSLLSDDIPASVRSDKLAVALQGVKIRSAHDKRRISAAALTFDGIAVGGKGHLHIASVGLDHIRIIHALNGQGDVKLDRAAISGVDVRPGDQRKGAFSVASLALKGVLARGVDGRRQSLRLATMKLTGLKAGVDGGASVAKATLQQLKATDEDTVRRTLQLATGELTDLSLGGNRRLKLKSLNFGKGALYVQDRRSASSPGRLLGAFDQAELKQFMIGGAGSGSFESFQLAGVQLPGVQLPEAGDKPLGSVGRIRVSQARLAKDGTYHVKRLQLDRLQARVIKRKNGWLMPPAMRANDTVAKKPVKKPVQKMTAQASASGGHDKSSQTANRTPAKKVSKGRVVIDAVMIGAGSRMSLHDESVTPALTTTLQLEQFRFAPLDSAGRQAGKLELKAKIDQSGSLRASGTLTPAAGDRLRADLHVSLHNIGLPRLSGYVEKDLGRSIKTGQLDLDSDISIGRNKLQSKNRLLIRKLQLDAPTHPENVNQHPDLAGGMSIDMALGMLQDDRGDIALDVPVNGPLDDPDINLDHIINKALLVSLKTGAMTYAALALQPYGSIILLADVAGGLIKNAAKPTLTPIRFNERQKTLSAAMQAYIGKIAALMQKKDFRLQVCGVATRIEGEVVMQPAVASSGQQVATHASVALPALNDAQLLALAQARSDLVVAALHERGIAANRLFNCSPAIDKAKIKTEPRVELLLD